MADVRQLEQRIAAVEARIKTAVAQSNTTLVQLFGVPSVYRRRGGCPLGKAKGLVVDQAPLVEVGRLEL
ncbi:MAG TPA: hypothetical protein VI357_20810, partial [Mycobacteriales bacterium]